MSEIKFEQIAPYLPYNLECEILNYKSDYVGEKYATVKGYYYLGNECFFNFKKGRDCAGKSVKEFKPILRPLEDLKKEITVNGKKFTPIKTFFREARMLIEHELKVTNGNIICDYMSYEIMLKLFEWHFDVFYLLDKGLAVNINSIKE